MPRDYFTRCQDLIVSIFLTEGEATRREQEEFIALAKKLAEDRDVLIGKYREFVAGFLEMRRLGGNIHNFAAIRAIAVALEEPKYHPDYDLGIIGAICAAARGGDFAAMNRAIKNYERPKRAKRRTAAHRAWEAVKAIRAADTEEQKKLAIQRLRLFKVDLGEGLTENPANATRIPSRRRSPPLRKYDVAKAE